MENKRPSRHYELPAIGGGTVGVTIDTPYADVITRTGRMEVQAQFASEQRQALVLQSPKANVVLANAEIMLDAAKLDRENLRNPTPAMIEVAEKRINEAQERYDDALKAITLLEDKIEKRDKESMDFLLQSVKEIVILPKDEERQIDWDKVDTDLIQEIRSFFRTGKRV